MLIDDVERYLALRRSLGFKLDKVAANLRAFAVFATNRGDTHVSAATAVEWSAMAGTRGQRCCRLGYTVRLATFLRAADPAHEIPPARLFVERKTRPIPYIYTPEELARILDKAGQLRPNIITPLRPQLYVTLFGVIAATGLRTSEALRLRLGDILPGGVLRIAQTKFNKSRLVPLHGSVVAALDRYLAMRRRLGTPDDHLFVGRSGKQLAFRAMQETFALVVRLANIAPDRSRRPRITDLRHTFATRALQRCAMRPQAVSRHFVALSTYLGHTNIKHTYWYLQAIPELMTDIAAQAEALVAGRSR
jgi:integrase/recombinase XerD